MDQVARVAVRSALILHVPQGQGRAKLAGGP